MTNNIVTGTKRIYPITEAAGQLGMSRTRIFALVQQGLINTIKVGRTRVITATELDRFTAELESGGIVLP